MFFVLKYFTCVFLHKNLRTKNLKLGDIVVKGHKFDKCNHEHSQFKSADTLSFLIYNMLNRNRSIYFTQLELIGLNDFIKQTIKVINVLKL